MIYGYIRPTIADIHCEQQLKILKSICEQVYKEEHDSAKNRTELLELLSSLSKGDKIVVVQLFAIADSSRHLMEILDILEKKGAYLQTIKEDIDTERTKKYSLSEMLSHLIEFQNEIIRERTKKGMEYAKQHGKTSGRPRKADENVKKAIEMYQSKKYTLKDIKEETGISKSTLYRYLEN
ncbi:resolvase [Niallia circulans]|uniref:Resolvase n=1 Tax=Niallia circulans TaxID=1397 RepID=A0A0J1HXZ0_NIACI|nr:recombinase family protein [Niallia circulans]KLV18556.1 resolvase [Niallia circulans]PAD26390.1 resolvase [Niallia circulans]PAD87299.1 resolvase [Niallia circulans]PAE11036.1 resolvase [Niallia circulans]